MTLSQINADATGTPRVMQVTRCVFTVSDATWGYATTNERAIETHWQHQKKLNPNYFNGPIWLLQNWSVENGDTFHGTFLQAEFRAYLYWRHRNFEPAGVFDAFGSGLVKSADGAILLGEQSPGNVKAGFSYPPSGFIDGDDVSDGRIDIDRHIAREILEETGLAVSSSCQRRSGYLITLSGAQISIAALFQSADSATHLDQYIAKTLERQRQGELAGVHWVRSKAEMAGLSVPAYVKVLMAALFNAQGG